MPILMRIHTLSHIDRIFMVTQKKKCRLGEKLCYCPSPLYLSIAILYHIQMSKASVSQRYLTCQHVFSKQLGGGKASTIRQFKF